MTTTGNTSTPTQPRRHPPLNSHQTIEAAAIPGARLQMRTVEALTGLSRSTIYRLMGRDYDPFPQPVRYGIRCMRWSAEGVLAWLEAQAKKGAEA